ncbi:MAG: aminoacyl-tRNA hydrolase [Patescibacteria group bacterium]|jgi:PTH1 family peptidyl-tRNA hydrolase
MKLIVGLGNPGKQYEKTRHNIGFRVLDEICDNWTLQKSCQALICKNDTIIYAKPQTFMNLSGLAVKKLWQFYKIEIKDILVVYDDKDLPFGKLRFRTKGSSGGHNGMNSIIAELGTSEFPRLRIGIAPTDSQTIIHDTADYVLAKFSKEEEKLLPEIINTHIIASLLENS